MKKLDEEFLQSLLDLLELLQSGITSCEFHADVRRLQAGLEHMCLSTNDDLGQRIQQEEGEGIGHLLPFLFPSFHKGITSQSGIALLK